MKSGCKSVLEYKKKYAGEFIIVKTGGSLASDSEVVAHTAEQISFLQHAFEANFIWVHGGKDRINQALQSKGLVPKEDSAGLRITDQPTLTATDSALRGLSGEIVSIFNMVAPDVRAVGMAGYDAQMISATPTSDDPDNFTGHVQQIDVEYVRHVMSYGSGHVVPIIYSICHNHTAKDGEGRLNVNADEVAASLAVRFNAKRLIMATESGILDKEGELIPVLSVEGVDAAIADKTIYSGMLPKASCAAKAASVLPSGGVVILNGREHEALINELLCDEGSGTLIARADELQAEGLLP